jgi:Kef-type K+ transport system membrane component KefB
MITPFFFIKGGMNLSLPEVAENWSLLLILFGIKSVAKFIGVWPLAKMYANNHAEYRSHRLAPVPRAASKCQT